MIEVPLNLPIDASLPEERERARRVLERAAQAADMFNVKLTPVIVTARSAGKAIVQEAIDRRAEVIVLGSQGKRRIADKVFGRTIDYVLDNLPCEAIINVIPKFTMTGAAVVGVGGATVVTPPSAAQKKAALAKQGASAAEAVEGAPASSTRGTRRAQGLRLGRYVSSRPGAGEAADEVAAGDGSPSDESAKPPADAGTRDSGAS